MHKKNSLLYKSMVQFIICTAIILLLAAPFFYWLVENYYAEDMIKVVEAAQQHQPIPEIDLEEDIVQGIMLQYVLITSVLGTAFVIVNSLISRHLWKPFYETLKRTKEFRLESGVVPALPESKTKEFTQLNESLTQLMENSMRSYLSQKEFIENASHELQTPMAVFQGKLDMLLQQPGITEPQANIIQELYTVLNRLTRLNRNLLLLAKIDNKQYKQTEEIDLISLFEEIQPFLENLIGDLTLRKEFPCTEMRIVGNKSLLEILINNLVVNAIRHNVPHGEIHISISSRTLTVANTSTEGELDKQQLFNRFYRSSEKVKGNGLGLSIAKAICDYHGWHIDYTYANNMQQFRVEFTY